MSQVEFIYNSVKTTIQCNHDEKLKDILQNYKNKTGNDLTSVYYLYS